MTRRTLILLAVALLLASAGARGSFIFESATGTPLSHGLELDQFFWPGHPLQITAPTRIGAIGGFFQNNSSTALNVFGAIVALSGPFDFPNSLDLSTPDVLGTTLVSVPAGSGDSAGSLPLSLAPGWYAVVFGASAFGADADVAFHVSMPAFTVDLSPFLAFAIIQPTNPFGTPAQILFSTSTSRFFVIAEPSSGLILIVAFACLAASLRRNTHTRSRS